MTDAECGADAPLEVSKTAELIERFSDHNFALHVLPAVLALDVALLATYQKNIWDAPWKELSVAHVGIGLCLATGYLVILTKAIPLFQALASLVLRSVSGWIDGSVASLGRNLFGPIQQPDFVAKESRVLGSSVTLRVAKERALRDRDSFWLPLVQAKEANVKANLRSEMRLARLSFATVLFGLIDVLAFPASSILNETVHGIAMGLDSGTDQIGNLILLAIAFLVAIPWVARTFSNEDGTVWIEHPALAEELLNEFYRKQAELCASNMPLIKPTPVRQQAPSGPDEWQRGRMTESR